MAATFPCTFDELKTRPGPPLNSWGLYGTDNELGRLNLIDEAAVLRGRDAIKHGIRVNLNLPLEGFPVYIPDRIDIHRKIHLCHHYVDEEVTFNTQSSTQWDGFKHYGYIDYPEKGIDTFHNGMTQAQAADVSRTAFGVQNFADYPITSRAHLLDMPRYLASRGEPALRAMSRDNAITVAQLQGACEAFGVELAPGDILIVRTGWTEGWLSLSPEEQRAETEKLRAGEGSICGVQASEEVMRWHWEKGIAAVASDTVAYEAYPSPFSPSIHEVFLAGWGLPLGEIFDLRKLAAECARLNQYSFMFTSMGLNLPGGVATPPNAQAIL